MRPDPAPKYAHLYRVAHLCLELGALGPDGSSAAVWQRENAIINVSIKPSWGLSIGVVLSTGSPLSIPSCTTVLRRFARHWGY